MLTESRNDDLTKDEIINALSMTLSNMIENQQAPSDKENEQVCRLIFDTINYLGWKYYSCLKKSYHDDK